MAAVEENRRLALTKARLTRLNGGGGRGDHGEAVDELGNAFLQWRAHKAMVMLGQNWRSYGCFDAACGGGEREANGAGDSVGQARGVLKTRLAVPGCLWRVAYTSRRPATGGATRPENSKPVGHDVTERFLKTAI